MVQCVYVTENSLENCSTTLHPTEKELTFRFAKNALVRFFNKKPYERSVQSMLYLKEDAVGSVEPKQK